MDKKERGELSVANKQKARQLKSVALSASSASTLCSGDVFMLRSRCNGGFLATALGQTLGGSDHHPVFCCRSSAPTVSSYAASIASISAGVAKDRRLFLQLLPRLRATGMHSSGSPQQLLFPGAMESNLRVVGAIVRAVVALKHMSSGQINERPLSIQARSTFLVQLRKNRDNAAPRRAAASSSAKPKPNLPPSKNGSVRN